MNRKIIEALHKGQVVCFPTETLYALAVDAYNLNAIENLYNIKKRDLGKPFAIVLHSIELLKPLISINNKQLSLMHKYLPGSVTFIVRRSKDCTLPMILGEKIGVRIPKHEKALSILKNFNGPLATTSANLSCSQDSKKFSDIPQEILTSIGCYIEDDEEISGAGSTIIDITTDPFTILRQGTIKL